MFMAHEMSISKYSVLQETVGKNIDEQKGDRKEVWKIFVFSLQAHKIQ